MTASRLRKAGQLRVGVTHKQIKASHLFKPSLGFATGVCTSHSGLMYVWVFTFVLKKRSWTWWKLSIELAPAIAVSEITGSGRVSREGQYAIYKTLLGCSSWSVISQLTAPWDTRGLSFRSPNRRPRRT